MDPTFRLICFPLDGELDFYFKKLIFIDYLKMTWSRYLFLFYFLKGKQNKQENPKCDSLFGKGDLRKIRLGWGVRLLIGKVW